MIETASEPIDKSTWGDGPWMTEPDRVDFVHAGFACMALRNPALGNWCGYVGVPREHPAYGKAAEDVDVDFHGGLNYASVCSGNICHTPEPGMPDDVWWLGGDFAHGWDMAPGHEATMRQFMPQYLRDGVYRDLPYVRREVEHLAEQLMKLVTE